jgi:hypothetical protein
MTEKQIILLHRRHLYKQTRTLVRTEGVITELVFEHALRIRMKEETQSDIKSSEDKKTADPSPASTPSSKSDSSHRASSNLVGKITNLITTDLGNIIEGRHFLLLAVSSPLQIGFCIWFLWEVLGWA